MNRTVRLYSIVDSPRLDYTLQFINDHPLFAGTQLVRTSDPSSELAYGDASMSSSLFIPVQGYFFQYVSGPWEAECHAHSWQSCTLQAVTAQSTRSDYSPDENVFPFDLFESIFFHISRFEEWYPASQNQEWDMLAESDHLLIKYGLEKIPVVDHLVKALWEFVHKKTFQSQKSTLRITHDIDHYRKFSSRWSILRKLAGFVRHRRPMRKLFPLIRSYWNAQWKNAKDPYDIYSWLLTDLPIDKTIYLFLEGQHPLDPRPPSDQELAYVISQAQQKEYAVGMHPSYADWVDSSRLEKTKKRLEKHTGTQVDQSRQHYLHFHFPKTLHALHRVGIRSDSSLGYNRHVGFRCGTGFPYRLYDFSKERSIPILEYPIAFMDSACLHEAKLQKDNFESIFNNFFQSNEQDACLTVNFHNSFFDEARMRSIAAKELYVALLTKFA